LLFAFYDQFKGSRNLWPECRFEEVSACLIYSRIR